MSRSYSGHAGRCLHCSPPEVGFYEKFDELLYSMSKKEEKGERESATLLPV